MLLNESMVLWRKRSVQAVHTKLRLQVRNKAVHAHLTCRIGVEAPRV